LAAVTAACALLALALELHLVDRLANGRTQQLEEVALDGLDHVVGGPRLERRDRELAVLGAGEIDDGRRVGEALADLREHLEAVRSRHVMVEDYEIEMRGRHQVERHGDVGGRGDGEVVAHQIAGDETHERDVVVDIEDARLAAALRGAVRAGELRDHLRPRPARRPAAAGREGW
jgi:hypothetical protein